MPTIIAIGVGNTFKKAPPVTEEAGYSDDLGVLYVDNIGEIYTD